MSKPASFDVAQIEFRALDESKRMASFVAATENGVMTWRGKEVLRVSGISLTRFNRNPVVLDTHDRYSVEAIVGRADMKVEGRQLVADVFFAETVRGNAAWDLVKKGFLRAVSIGFIPDPSSIVDLRQGQFDGEGDSRVEGPARVINRSEAFELSVVPVPADPDALRRHFEELSMSKETQQPAAPAAAPAQTSAPVPAPAQRGAEPISQEVAGELFRREVVAIAPRSLNKDVVDGIILESDGDLTKARTRLMEEHKKLMPPVGTPEPAPITKSDQQRGQEGTQPAADEGLLIRSLCAPARSE